MQTTLQSDKVILFFLAPASYYGMELQWYKDLPNTTGPRSHNWNFPNTRLFDDLVLEVGSLINSSLCYLNMYWYSLQ